MGMDEVSAALAGGGGGWTKIASGSVSAVAALDLTGITKTTRITMGITTWANEVGQGLALRMSTNGGSSYDTSSIHNWAIMRLRQDDSAVIKDTATNSSSISLWQGLGVTTNTNSSYSYVITVFKPENSRYKNVEAVVVHNDGGSSVQQQRVAGVYRSTSVVNAIRLFAVAGGSAVFTGDYVVEELTP